MPSGALWRCSWRCLFWSMKNKLVNRTAGNAHNMRIFTGTDMKGIKNFLPPDNSKAFGTIRVGTPNFWTLLIWFNAVNAKMIATGPKSFSTFRIFGVKKIDVSRAITCMVDQKVTSAIDNETNGIDKFIGSANMKFRRRLAQAS